MCSEEKKVLVFDLDGTIFEDFLERDKVHINRIFEDNIIVKFIDSVARFVNSFDLIKNSMLFLRLRLAIYSLFVLKSFSQILREYRKWYREEVAYAIIRQMARLQLLEKNYEIIILSNNSFSDNLVIEKKYLNCDYTLITAKSKLKALKSLIKKYDIRFVIGNNLTDDILSSRKLNIDNIYIGKNRIGKKLAKYSVDSLKEAIECIKSNKVK